MSYLLLLLFIIIIISSSSSSSSSKTSTFHVVPYQPVHSSVKITTTSNIFLLTHKKFKILDAQQTATKLI